MSAVPPPSRADAGSAKTLPRADAGSAKTLPRADFESTEELSIDELDAAICTLARGMNTFHSTLLRLVRDFDERFGWAKWGFGSCAEWLAWRCGIGPSAAREKVRTAQALRDLPAISKAFDAGRVSYSKVRALTRAANESNEEALLGFALEANAAQVEERCRQIRNAREDSVEEARGAWQRRSLSIFRDSSRGTLRISVELPLDAGELVAKAVDRAVQVGDVARGAEFGGEGWPAQQADALVAVARAYLSGMTAEDVAAGAAEDVAAGAAEDVAAEGAEDVAAEAAEDVAGANATAQGAADTEAMARITGDGAATERKARRSRPACLPRAVAADHYQVVVHVDEAALRGRAGRSELPIETVRRLACDGSVTVVTENASGDPLNVGRRQRIVPLGLRRALWSRDRGCTFPGCRNMRYLHAHHLRHWANGGETSLGNTVLLCTHHHRLVHEGGLRVQRDADGELEFRRADGRAIPRCGYRVEDAAPDPIFLEGVGYHTAVGRQNPSAERQAHASAGGRQDSSAEGRLDASDEGDLHPSAEGWLAALVSGRRSSDRVREASPIYCVQSS